MKKPPLYLLCFLSVLSGCQEEDAVPSKAQKRQEIAKDLHTFKVPEEPPSPPPLEEVKEEPLMKEEPEFPDVRPLMREQRARRLRADRQRQSYQRDVLKKPQIEATSNLRLSDPDYQQWEDSKFPQNKSTYPVERDRILTSDMRIWGILEDGVNSQTPGRLVAVVDRDILSPTQKKILIPAYSRVICRYQGLGEVGHTRLPVQCYRIIRPDGVSISLKNAMGADQAGRSGLIGEVDNRTWERYGAAFVVSALTALTQAGSYATSNEMIAGGANALSNNLGQVTAKVLEQNIDLTPIITIPQGARIQILPQYDIVLRCPKKIIEGKK